MVRRTLSFQKTCIVLGATVLLSAFSAWAAPLPSSPDAATVTVAGVDLPRYRYAFGVPFRLHGAGGLHVTFYGYVYVAALYLGEGVAVEDVQKDVAKRVEIHFLAGIGKKRIISAADKALQRNLDEDTLTALRPDVERLHAVYRDATKNSTSSLTRIPGQGTVYTVDGVEVFRSADPVFVEYFNVWLGDPPSSTSVKRKLLRRIGD